MKKLLEKILKIVAAMLIMLMIVPVNQIDAAYSRNINYSYNGTQIYNIRVKTDKATTFKFSSIKGKVELMNNFTGYPTVDSHQPYIVQVLEVTRKGEKLHTIYHKTTSANIKLKANTEYKINIMPLTKEQTYNWMVANTPWFRWHKGVLSCANNTRWLNSKLPKFKVEINNVSVYQANSSNPKNGSTLGINYRR